MNDKRSEIIDFIAATSAPGPSGNVGGKLAADILDRLEGNGFAVTGQARPVESKPWVAPTPTAASKPFISSDAEKHNVS